jgi:renalase
MERIAVIGAGIAGLAAARALHDGGREVIVFDKARGVGGRMSTRRAGGQRIDHGAQYFTARDPAFQREVDVWEQRGVVERWPRSLVRITAGEAYPLVDGQARYRGAPGMNEVCRHLGNHLALRSNARIRKMACGPDGWELRDGDGDWLGPFSDVVVSVPAPQARELLRPVPELAKRLEAVKYDPCWAVLLMFDEPLDVEFEAAFVEGRDVAWVARRMDGGRESWIVHATPVWSALNQDALREDVLAHVKKTLGEILGQVLPAPAYERTHFWRYAKVTHALEEPFLWDSMRNVGVCGDGCLGGRVESAWLSGRALADAVGRR